MKYENMSSDELREKIINGQIDSSDMTEEDYRRVFFEESRYEEANIDVIDFCINGLSEKIIVPAPTEEDFEKLVKKYNESDKDTKKKISKPFRLILVAAIIIIISTLFVIEAAGFGILKFIFNNEKENMHVSIEVSNPDTDNVYMETSETAYESYGDVPENLKNNIPQIFNDKYSFDEAIFRTDNNVTLTVYYKNNNEYLMYQFIEYSGSSNSQVILPKDEEFYEEYLAGSDKFTIVSNEDSLTCYWQESNKFFYMSTYEPIEEVHNILDYISRELPFFNTQLYSMQSQ